MPIMARKRSAKQRSDDVRNAYFEWMESIVCEGTQKWRRSYNKLLRLLHATEFVYILDMDANRADDGVDLRLRFVWDRDYNSRSDEILGILDDRPCSVLEMMVALAQRCEEHITDDPESGDRTGKWFFSMLESLGLLVFDDAHFDKIASADILDRFMQRRYQPSGQGGLFTVSDESVDMRDIEIWYQMMRYLNETVYGRRK